MTKNGIIIISGILMMIICSYIYTKHMELELLNHEAREAASQRLNGYIRGNDDIIEHINRGEYSIAARKNDELLIRNTNYHCLYLQNEINILIGKGQCSEATVKTALYDDQQNRKCCNSYIQALKPYERVEVREYCGRVTELKEHVKSNLKRCGDDGDTRDRPRY